MSANRGYVAVDYEMTVRIPIKDVPDDTSIYEAKVTSEIWLKEKIPDAELIDFKRAGGNYGRAEEAP